jgi:hypothetical protein
MLTSLGRCIRQGASNVRPYHASALAQQAAGAPTPEAESSTAAQARQAAIQKAKAAAWYLKDNVEATTITPPSSESRQPRFTPYNPLSTLPQPATDQPLAPLPLHFPEFLKPLHEYLTTNPLIIPHSVTAFDSSSSFAASLFHDSGSEPLPRGRRRRGTKDAGQGIVVDGVDVGANWSWIYVVETGARGKGAVGRVERDIRKWASRLRSVLIPGALLNGLTPLQFYLNPLNMPSKPEDSRLPKFPTTALETDWSLFDAGHGVCVNIMTAEGREKWDLDALWKKK